MKCARAVALMEPLRNEFAARFYNWCLEESASEQRAGFPSIRAIPSYVSLLFLEFAAGGGRRGRTALSQPVLILRADDPIDRALQVSPVVLGRAASG
jgi:hypothetical protein